MVTRTFDIDHPDRNCVSRSCDDCGTVINRYHHHSSAMLDAVEQSSRAIAIALDGLGRKDLCRKCLEKLHAKQEADGRGGDQALDGGPRPATGRSDG